MKFADLTGQPSEKADLIVLYANGVVMVHRDNNQFNSPTQIGLTSYTGAVRLGVGNVVGDSPSRKFDTPRDSDREIQAQTGNAGQVLDSSIVDPRSLDVVVVKDDGTVYLIEGHYAATKTSVLANMEAHADPLNDGATGNPFAFSSTREITSIDVHDMDGDGLADIVLAYKDDTDAVYRSCLLYTSPSPRDMRRSRMPSSA